MPVKKKPDKKSPKKQGTGKKTVRKVTAKKAPKTVKKGTKKTTQKKTVRKRVQADRNEELRKVLVEGRKSILKEAGEEIAKFIKGETKQLVDTALDDGDWSFIDMAEDVNLKKLSSHKDTLNKIDEAIRKVNEGTYGVCEDCGGEISDERLKIIPFAIYCVECKELREKFEEFESQSEF